MNSIIKFNIYFILVMIISGTSIADSWISPVEIKYKNAYPDLYSKYDQAKTMISNYRGNQNDLKDAKALLDEVIEGMRSFAPAYREYGRLVAKSGYISYRDYEGSSLEISESLVLESINLEPDYADAYVYLGYLYTTMRKYDKAGEALAKAEDIGTGLAWLNYNWAELLRYEGKDNEAIKRYKAVIDSNTDNKTARSSALQGIAMLYRSSGDYENAKIWFDKNIQFEPESAWNWGNYGDFLLFYYGDVDGAISKYEKALSIMNYGVARSHYACALYTKWVSMYKKDSSNPEVASLYNKASEIEPDHDVIINQTIRYETTKDTARFLDQQKLDKLRKEIEDQGVIQINPNDFIVDY